MLEPTNYETDYNSGFCIVSIITHLPFDFGIKLNAPI